MSDISRNIATDIGDKINEIKNLLNICDEHEERKCNKILNSYNRIIFGAPGTGKSYKLNKDIEDNNLKGLYKRVTFHPNYTYAQFVRLVMVARKCMKRESGENPGQLTLL